MPRKMFFNIYRNIFSYFSGYPLCIVIKTGKKAEKSRTIFFPEHQYFRLKYRTVFAHIAAFNGFCRRFLLRF